MKDVDNKIRDAFIYICDGLDYSDLVYITGMSDEKAIEIIELYKKITKD